MVRHAGYTARDAQIENAKDTERGQQYLNRNFEVRGAAFFIKLQHFDLWRRFAFGAFGDDHFSRRDLLPVAVKEARRTGLAPSGVVVIGDTPLDVDCAQANSQQYRQG